MAPKKAEGHPFIASLMNEDPLGVVIRGHLYIESNLIRVIEEALPDPGAIDLTRLNFPLKLDLAVALKLLPETEKGGYAKLNALRNQLAHKFDAPVLETDEKSLYQTLSKEQKTLVEAYSQLSTNPSFPLLRASIASLGRQSYFLLDDYRQHKSKPSE